MARRMMRRRFSRSFAGRKGGRQYWWLRFTPFNLSLQTSMNATHSDLILLPSDYADPTGIPNSTQRGGPRLERLIMDYGLTIEADFTFFATSGDANLAQIPEFMVWTQQDQFATSVTGSATFDSTRDSNRVLMNELPNMEDSMVSPGAPNLIWRTTRGRVDIRSKARLADKAIGCAWRGLFNTADPIGYTDWVRPTFLVSVP